MSKDYYISEQGRKIRSDSFESCHNVEKIMELLNYYYWEKNLSTNEIPKIIKEQDNIDISAIKVFQLLKKFSKLRGKSESISMAKSSLDAGVSYLEDMTDIIEGLIIGDANLTVNENTKKGRLTIAGAQKEFIEYCYSLLTPYMPSEPIYGSYSNDRDHGVWVTRTKYHPDLYKIYHKWYENSIKDIPVDIKLTPRLVLLWYLGDGSISAVNNNNTRTMYFATNSFSKKKLEMVSKKFHRLNINISGITKDNRLFVDTKSINDLLKYMGGESPVDCYSYKFEIESWRLKKPMKEVSKELDIDYGRLANWVKRGVVNHSRSPMGKKVVFSDREFKDLKNLLDTGKLSRDKGKKSKKSYIKKEDKKNYVKKSEMSIDDYLLSIVDLYQKEGFPINSYSSDELEKQWYRVRASQYIIPKYKTMKWREYGISLADFFHPNIYNLSLDNKISPFELFSDKKLFFDCLKRNKAWKGVTTKSKVLKIICEDSFCERVNNFSPSLARDLYNFYCPHGGSVIDPFGEFSGRMIGASVSKRNLTYSCIDNYSDNYDGLIETKDFITKLAPDFECNIVNGRTNDEIKQFNKETFDFCLTSFPEKIDCGVIKDIFLVMKSGSFCAIHLKKKDFKNELSIFKEVGFDLVEVKTISFKDDYRGKDHLIIFKK